MGQSRQGLDSGGQSAAGDQGVLPHRRVVAGVGSHAVDGDLKAVPAPEADGHVVVAALRHDGIVRADALLHQLIGTLAEAFLVRDEACLNAAGDLVLVLGIVLQRLQNGR